MNRQRFLYLCYVLVFAFVFGLVACAPQATYTPSPAPTDTLTLPPPAPTITPTTALPIVTNTPIVTVAPSVTPLPSGIEILLPDDAVSKLKSVGDANKLTMLPLARQHTVLYAFPDTGVASLLTPVEKGPGLTAEELAKNPGAIQNVSLGGLTVIIQTTSKLTPDDYIITLTPDRETVRFIGSKTQASFPVVIRSLPLPVPRPVALITSSQMCLAWDTTQICARVETPLRPDLMDQLTNAIKGLDVPLSAIALDRAIPDVEGRGMLGTCAKALSQESPDYAACRATVLAAPTVKDGAFPAPHEEGKITAIGVLLVLEKLEEDVYRDPELTQSVGELPDGPYKTFEVLLPGEEPAPGKPVNTRVRQSGPAGDFYLPAVSGGVIIGTAILGSGPTNEEEAIIVNLWQSGRCAGFKWWQCPWIK
jgi:hypothetical protein